VTDEEFATMHCVADASVEDGPMEAQPPVMACQPGAGGGLRASYFDSLDFTGPAIIHHGQGLVFDWQESGPAPGARADDWSATWTGYLQPQVTGDHTFFVAADDGYRLWLDGELLLDRWTGALSHTLATTVRLDHGRRYEMLLEYFDAVSTAKLDVTMKPPLGERGPIPRCMLAEGAATQTACPAALGPCMPAGTPACANGTGLRATYTRLDSAANETHVVAAAAPAVDFTWLSDEDRMRAVYRVTWEGTIEVPPEGASDIYTFYLVSDGASSMTIGGRTTAFTEVSSDVRPELVLSLRLFSGLRYPIRITYTTLDGPQWGWLQLRWKGSLTPKGIVPTCRLHPPQ
jgi:hypothetical protein